MALAMRNFTQDSQNKHALFSSRATPTCAALLCLAISMIAGCAGGSGNVTVTKTYAGLRCYDDSARCKSQRQTALNTLLADSSFQWVNQPVPPEAYASGVRLFAFKKRKKQLNCAQLRRGHLEAKNAKKVLRGRSDNKFTPAQASRGIMLAAEISRELQREIRRRCA